MVGRTHMHLIITISQNMTETKQPPQLWLNTGNAEQSETNLDVPSPKTTEQKKLIFYIFFICGRAQDSWERIRHFYMLLPHAKAEAYNCNEQGN